jgi:aspartate/methionine/tyrosine aminotransferase
MHAAKNAGLSVDKFYVMKALEETGIILAPFGYGQDPRTFHFRITIMSPEENLEDLLLSFKAFNNNFHNQYKDSI